MLLRNAFVTAQGLETLAVLSIGVLNTAGPALERKSTGIRLILSLEKAVGLPELYILGNETDASTDGLSSEGGLRRRPRQSRHACPLAGNGETS